MRMLLWRTKTVKRMLRAGRNRDCGVDQIALRSILRWLVHKLSVVYDTLVFQSIELVPGTSMPCRK